MKELELNFTGKGEVKGYEFYQLLKTDLGYIYEKKHIETNSITYEVFKHKENAQFNCVSYPSSKSFGVWAWECATLERANNLFNTFKPKNKENV